MEIPAQWRVAAATVEQIIAEYAAAARIFATRAAFEFRAPPMAVTPLLNQLAERAWMAASAQAADDSTSAEERGISNSDRLADCHLLISRSDGEITIRFKASKSLARYLRAMI